MNQGDSSPPPAYDEQAFDQKISSALQVSLSTPQPPQRNEERWEEWDDRVFDAAAQALSSWGSHGPSGSSQAGSSARSHPPEKLDDAQSPGLPIIEPLRIHKKAWSPAVQSKPRPSWFSESEGDARSSASTSSTLQHDIPPEDEEDHSIPPPPFTAIAPSLDGQPVIVMAYHPSGELTPPSPLHSPIRRSLEFPASSHDHVSPSRPPSRMLPDQSQLYAEQSRPHPPIRRSLPAPPHPHNVAQQPSTTFSSKPMQSSSIPRMNFNPSVAYSQGGGISELPLARYPTQQFDPNGFYNSAVSAHLSTGGTPAKQSHSTSIPGQQSTHHSRSVGYNPGHQSVLYDGRTARGNHIPVAPTPGSSHLDPWPSGTPVNIPHLSIDPQYVQHHPGYIGMSK